MRARFLSSGRSCRWEPALLPLFVLRTRGQLGSSNFLTGVAPPSAVLQEVLQGPGAQGKAVVRSCASSWLARPWQRDGTGWSLGYYRVLDPPQLCTGHIWDSLEGPRELICSLLTAKAVSQNCIKPTSSFSSKLSLETTCPWASTGTCSLSPGTSLKGMVLRRLERETCYSQGGSWRFFHTKPHIGIAALEHGREFAGDSFLIPLSCVDVAPISIRGWSEQPLRPGDSSA